MKKKPSLLNKICAHPIVLSWGVAALVLNVAVLTPILQSASLSTILGDYRLILLLIFAPSITTFLSYFISLFTLRPLSRRLCTRVNAGELEVGDRVTILSGDYKGTDAKVAGIAPGKDGWELAKLDLGKEITVIVELYSLFKK